MKLLVFPEARRQDVETVVAEALGGLDRRDGLTVTIVRIATANEWTVHAAGLGDPVLERTLCNVIQHALRCDRS